MFQRWLILLAAVLMQICLGSTYAWSVFVQPIRDATGLGQGAAQVPFSTFYFVFPLTMAVLGSLRRRPEPRVAAAAGGLLFGAGWMIAGWAGADPRWTVAGVGVLGGIGAGFAYLVPVATAMAWFPRHPGLVTGITVAGFGGGAALVGRAASHLIHGVGLTPYHALAWIGAVNAATICVTGLAMRRPAGSGSGDEPADAPARATIASAPFLALFATFFVGLSAGLTVIANLKHLHAGDAASGGVAAVAWFATANAAGRIVWGRLFDRAAPVKALVADLLSSGLLFAVAPLLLPTRAGTALFAALAGFNYGGILAMHPAMVARLWGRANLQRVYGWLVTAHFPATLAPMLAGFAYDSTGSHRAWLTSLSLLCLGAVLFVVHGHIRRSNSGFE